MNQPTEIFGSFEYISVPELGITNVIAKIDTGAYSGALHCSHIKEILRKSDNKMVLRFTPSDKEQHATEVEQYHKVYVRSSTGHQVRRYLFDTNIVIKGKTYPIVIGLADRSDMQYEVLIGRRFLRENNILVDVRVNQELDIDGENKSYENRNLI